MSSITSNAATAGASASTNGQNLGAMGNLGTLNINGQPINPTEIMSLLQHLPSVFNKVRAATIITPTL